MMEQLIKKSLHDALKHTDDLQTKLKTGIDGFNTLLKEYESLPGYNEIKIQSVPRIDIHKIQQELIDAHRGNHYLDEVVKGNDTFVNIITDLYKRKHTGWKAFWPLREDEAYNREVKDLKEIIHTGFEIGGFSEWCKPVTMAMIMGFVGLTYGGITQALAPEKVPECAIAMAGGMLSSGGLLFGCVVPLSKKEDFKRIKTNAEYLDKKIEEMYR